MKSAPLCCIRALIQCANDHESEHPNAALVTKRDFYVDDLVISCDEEEYAIKLHAELTQLLSKGCFELAKWESNSWYVHSKINGNSIEDIPFDKEIEDSVLGNGRHLQTA